MNEKTVFKNNFFLFFMMNLVAFFHAYQFTHFADENARKTDKKNTFDKVKALVFGVNNPRPTSKIVPKMPFEVVYLESSKKIECCLGL